MKSAFRIGAFTTLVAAALLVAVASEPAQANCKYGTKHCVNPNPGYQPPKLGGAKMPEPGDTSECKYFPNSCGSGPSYWATPRRTERSGGKAERCSFAVTLQRVALECRLLVAAKRRPPDIGSCAFGTQNQQSRRWCPLCCQCANF